jgi:hypothetical protein
MKPEVFDAALRECVGGTEVSKVREPQVRGRLLANGEPNYESHAGDKFSDLKKSPKGPGRLQGFIGSVGLERSAA